MADYRTMEKLDTVINAMTATAVTVASDEYSATTNCTIIDSQTAAANAEGATGVDCWLLVTVNSGDNNMSIYAEKSLDGTNYATKEFALTAHNNGAVISGTGTYYCGRIYGLPSKMRLTARVENGTSATVAIDAYPFYTQSDEV